MNCQRCFNAVIRSSDFYDVCEQAGMYVDRSTGQVGTRGGLHSFRGGLDKVMRELDSRKRQQEELRELFQRLSAQRGMKCLSCGSVFCVDCLLEHAPPHPDGGKACPTCGGRFDALE
jgi:hypothetical protein